MLPEFCDVNLLIALPDELFASISQSLLPRDICNLSLCCKSLRLFMASEKIWFTQCDKVELLPHKDLVDWRKGVSSYKSLCRFLVSVKPLTGIWVHQNPELGNLVYVMPGFVSVVGCRIIPQELGPFGINDGPILWAPVFEIIGDVDGSTMFFLHGREKECDYFYPGSVKSVDKTCNVLLLEVEPKQQMNGGKLLHSKSFVQHSDVELSRKIRNADNGLSKSQRMVGQCQTKVPFNRLAFSDRRKLLETVLSQVLQKLPDTASGPLFPRPRIDKENFQRDLVLLSERRSLLIQMYKFGGVCIEQKEAYETHLNYAVHHSLYVNDGHTNSLRTRTLGGYFRNSIKQIFGKPSGMSGRHNSKCSSANGESKYAQLHDFLRSSDTVGLTVHASTMRLSTYRAWPNMHDSRFALYKLPTWLPRVHQEYAGLWGGTFGWPPWKPSEDKPGKALFFLLLSYEESERQQRLLIATKILEGTHYVLHPNGSAMFIANLDEPSIDLFPFVWDAEGDSPSRRVSRVYTGEGIANGYGFRFPGSKPGSLFAIQNGLLAFVWKESRSVLTLQRLNLQDLLRKGERVPALPPIANFSYLTKSYSNVFAASQMHQAHQHMHHPQGADIYSRAC